MDHVIGAYSRAVAVERLAGFVAAEAEIKIRKFMLWDRKCPEVSISIPHKKNHQKSWNVTKDEIPKYQ